MKIKNKKNISEVSFEGCPEGTSGGNDLWKKVKDAYSSSLIELREAVGCHLP